MRQAAHVHLEHDWLVAGPLCRAFDFPTTLVPKVVANDFLFLREVATSGGGIATLPTFIAQPYVASGDLVRVLPSVRVNVGGLVMLYSSTRPLARKVAAFRDFMIDVVKRSGWAEPRSPCACSSHDLVDASGCRSPHQRRDERHPARGLGGRRVGELEVTAPALLSRPPCRAAASSG